MFWLMVLRPALVRTGADGGVTRRSIGEEFRSLVNTAIGVLLVTGIVLSAARLTDNAVTTFYVAVLVVKIVLALYMFYVVRFLRPQVYPDDDGKEDGRLRRIRDRLTGTTALLIYGVVILGLSDVLNALFESAVRN
jgi:putative copper export protein